MSATPNLPTVVVALDLSTVAVLAAGIAEHLSRTGVTYDTSPMEPRWLDSRGAAERLGISRDALYKRVKAGQIPAHQDRPDAKLFFDRDELDDSRRTGRR